MEVADGSFRNVITIDSDSDSDVLIVSPPRPGSFDLGFQNGPIDLVSEPDAAAGIIFTPATSDEPTPLGRNNVLTPPSPLHEQTTYLDLEDYPLEVFGSPETFSPLVQTMPRRGTVSPPTQEMEADPAVLYQLFLDKVLEVIPDVDPAHIKKIYDSRVLAFGAPTSTSPRDDMSNGVILEILDSKDYPKKVKAKDRKRKRRSDDELDPDEEKKWILNRKAPTKYEVSQM